MPTYTNTFAINGVVDTSGTILSNLQEICKASGCWLSYNIAMGKWDVVINTTGSSVKSFDVSNIVGSVSVMTTALTEYYNSVEIEFPHRDLKDTRDFENYSIATGNLLPNERTNLLTITSKLINNPVQAQLIAARELKQSRVDKVIQFTTDYTSLGLQAGDLIDVTLTQYAFNSKVFRITSLEEEDDNEGNLLIRITALEYDANVYSTSGLTYTEKTLDNQIRTSSANSAVTNSDQASTTKDVSDALNNVGNAALAATLIANISKNIGGGGGSLTALSTAVLTKSQAEVNSAFNGYAGSNVAFASNFNGDPTSILFINFSLTNVVQTLVVEISVPIGSMDFNNSSRLVSPFVAYFPSQYGLFYNGVQQSSNTADWQTSYVKLILNNAQIGNYQIQVFPLLTYDLDQATTIDIFPFNFNSYPLANGSGLTVTLFAYSL